MSCKLRKFENFGLVLHPSSPKPVNLFGAQSSLGGAQQVIWGGTLPVCPPWRRVCNWAAAFQHKKSTSKCSIQYSGHKIWKELPLEIKGLHGKSYFTFLKTVENFILENE